MEGLQAGVIGTSTENGKYVCNYENKDTPFIRKNSCTKLSTKGSQANYKWIMKLDQTKLDHVGTCHQKKRLESLVAPLTTIARYNREQPVPFAWGVGLSHSPTPVRIPS